jgi:hypothetical protein
VSLDQSNDYPFAGPGAKRRRERLTLDTIPKKIAKAKPYKYRKPENAQEETIRVTARGMKAKIARLTLQHDSFGDIYERLDREGYGVASKVLAGIRSCKSCVSSWTRASSRRKPSKADQAN